MVLIAAVLITSVLTGSTSTVTAATNVTDIVTGDDITTRCEITMKPGDVKKVTVHDKTGKDIQESFNFKVTEGEGTVINAEDDFVSNSDYTCCINIIGLKEGSATIVGQRGSATSSMGREFVEIKVTVKMPKATMTAKQKKCKHKYKVTKKATCERPGIKTCTKCKWQKTIAQKKHVYETKQVKVTRPTYQYYTVECTHTVPNGKFCGLSVTTKLDMNGNPLPDSKYKNLAEMTAALTELHKERREHLGLENISAMEYQLAWQSGSEDIYSNECLYMVSWGDSSEDGKEYEIVNVTDEFCKYCHRQKEAIENGKY